MSIYPKLAVDGIRKNRRLYLPYILTASAMVLMHYVISFLSVSEALCAIRGGDMVASMMGFGKWTVAVFACLFLFYTNSFSMRRRKKEFGLYSILGMGKKNIALVLLFETLTVAAISVGAGIFFGAALSKLAELGLINIMHGDVSYGLSFSFACMGETALLFAALFALLYLNSLRQIGFSSAVSLWKSETVGERAPRSNPVLGVFGILILIAAYGIAVSVQEVIAAFTWFFIAVLAVIVATYLIMIAGSVFLCRVLQKNKRYYYRPSHFVSVSSMTYRMKRNGAGLASICILCTMILVIVSSTTCLYFGEEDALNSRYPREVNAEFGFASAEDLHNGTVAAMRERLDAYLSDNGCTPQNVFDVRCATVVGWGDADGNVTLIPNLSVVTGLESGTLYQFYFVSDTDYTALTGTSVSLAPGEILLAGDFKSAADTLCVDGKTFPVAGRVNDSLAEFAPMASVAENITVVVRDGEFASTVTGLTDGDGEESAEYCWYYRFDTGLGVEDSEEICSLIISSQNWAGETAHFKRFSVESREANRWDFYATFGGFFYLGIVLCIVFVFATVLIIYYKQITEGYEDAARFDIMKKVGMTEGEIRRSVNSQLLTVFYLPLVFAGMHLAFAFPMIEKLIALFGISNVALFALTTGITFAVFAVFYTLVYRVTSREYLRIVNSGANA